MRLKSGDPGIFGRATEELDAARKLGIPIELVPGVTAASAAGASLGKSLTERGVANTLVLATGTGCSIDPRPDSARLSSPGTTTAFYMSVGQADRLSKDLMRRGLPPESPVEVCVDVSKRSERHFSAALNELPEVILHNRVTGCAIILVTWPQTTRATSARIDKTVRHDIHRTLVLNRRSI